MSSDAAGAARMYLEDMAESIETILEYTKGMTATQFSKDRKTVDSVCFNLAILGEAANKISPKFQKSHPEIQWREIVSTRNKLIHNYAVIDDEILWDIVQTDLPTLLQALRSLTNCAEK